MDAVVLTPKAAHFARLDAVIKRENALGSFLIKGIDRDEDEGDEDEDDEGPPIDENALTAEQVATLRHIVINAARDKKNKLADKLVTDGQAGKGFMMMFNTHTGNEAIFGSLKEVSREILCSPTSIHKISFNALHLPTNHITLPRAKHYYRTIITPHSQQHHTTISLLFSNPEAQED
jgi:hypothetical protein